MNKSSMKKRLESAFHRLVKYDSLWPVIQPFAKLGLSMVVARRRFLRKTEIETNHEFLKSLRVQNGPFKGIKYKRIDSVGSAIYPKLLGSYESELHFQLEELLENNYSEIIDVGCAEGYYAIGLAMRQKKALVYAYDVDEKARMLCQEMAELNGVQDKIEIRSELTPELLGTFTFSTKGLILCDCEGFEKKLFNEENIKNLLNCDLIIETHDFIDINISTYLKQLFKETHELSTIMSKDDIQKALHYDFKELDDLPLQKKKDLLTEGRPAIMEWLICKSKLK